MSDLGTIICDACGKNIYEDKETADLTNKLLVASLLDGQREKVKVYHNDCDEEKSNEQ